MKTGCILSEENNVMVGFIRNLHIISAKIGNFFLVFYLILKKKRRKLIEFPGIGEFLEA